MTGLKMPNLVIRRINILEDPLEEGAYDLVTARAILHHLPAQETAVQRMTAALKSGGALVSIEPDFLPATAAEPESMHRSLAGVAEVVKDDWALTTLSDGKCRECWPKGAWKQ